MNVTTLRMPKELARAKWKTFRAEAHLRADQEYEQAAKVYKALAEDVPVIDVARTIHACDTFEDGLPRLAVARADRERVTCKRWRGNEIEFDARKNTGWGARESRELLLFYQHGKHQPEEARGTTLVPMVPAEKRPKANLSGFFLLWEVEQWEAQADRDPILLKRLSTNLFAVVAEWDLTDVERAIMEGSR